MSKNVIAVATVAVVLGSALNGQSRQATANCFTESLEIEPAWISTAEFDSRSGYVLVADPKEKRVLSLDPSSREMKEVQLPRELMPVSVTKVQGGILARSRQEAVVFEPGTTNSLRKVSLGEAEAGIGSLYSNWITNGRKFLGFGSVRHAGTDMTRIQHDPSRGFQLGFVTGQISASGEFSNVKLLEASEDNGFYLLGFQYFAATDRGLFFIRIVGGRASIMEVQDAGVPTLREVKAFPGKFSTVPKLRSDGSRGSDPTETLFAEIASSRLPVGLFGKGEMLYLLTRERSLDGDGTLWLLHQIHPDEASPRGVFRLPTNAEHLTVVVGADEWFLFERGRVRGWGSQLNQTLVRVPSEWILSPSASPISAGNPTVLACPKR